MNWNLQGLLLDRVGLPFPVKIHKQSIKPAIHSLIAPCNSERGIAPCWKLWIGSKKGSAGNGLDQNTPTKIRQQGGKSVKWLPSKNRPTSNLICPNFHA
jgi:hypothetical protein